MHKSVSLYVADTDRTKNRPIASGVVSYKQATAFLGLQLAAGLAILVNLNGYRYAEKA